MEFKINDIYCTEHFINVAFESPIELPEGDIKGKILHNGNQIGRLSEVEEGNIIHGVLFNMSYLNLKDDFTVQIENEEEK